MPVTFADRLLRVRYVALLAAVFVLAALIPPIQAVWPPTLAFTNEIGTLIVDGGELTVDWSPSAADQDEIVVRLWRANGTAIALGRAPTYPTDIDDTHVLSSNDFVMVCDATGGSVRYLFGSVVTRRPNSPAAQVDLVSYKGPAASGARFAHGLYLVVLAPGAVDADATVDLLRSDGLSRRTARIFDDAVQLGRRQPSGCFVA